MTEEKQQKINEILEKETTWQKRAVMVLVVCLLSVFLILGGLLTFLQLTVFEVPQEKITADSFLSRAVSGKIYGEKGFVVTVPAEVVAAETELYISEQLGVKGRATLETLVYDSADQRLKMNLFYKGFYLPISYHLAFSQIDNGVLIDYSDLAISNRGIKAGDWLTGRIDAITGLEESQQVIDFSEIDVNKGLRLSDLWVSEGLPVVNLTVDIGEIRKELTALKEAAVPRLVEYYRTFSPERNEKVLEMVDSYLPLSAATVRDVINDTLQEQFILSDLLLLAEGYDITSLDKLLSSYNLSLDMDKIARERKAFKGQAADGEIAKVFYALDQYFMDKVVAFNQGKPFDIETMTTMTVQKLIETYRLDIEPELASALTFVYDDAFKVAYQLDGDTYYLRSLDGYEVITAAVYQEYLGAGVFSEPVLVSDAALWQQAVDVAGEVMGVQSVFVRYMKSDGQSLFAVVSPDNNPQELYGMAMVLEEGIMRVLDSHVTSVANLIAAHPTFNVATMTKAIESVSFKRIGQDIYDLIIEELYGQSKISSRTEASIVYSAYDGKKYIAFKLSSGDEYVYKVQITYHGTYLSDLYTKEKAKRNWSDIPELLMLQDSPE